MKLKHFMKLLVLTINLIISAVSGDLKTLV